MSTVDRSQAIDRKARMAMDPVPHAYRPPQQRVLNFAECAIPFTPEQAMLEASRCIQCPTPACVAACPLGNNVPEALWAIEQGDFLGAAAIYRATNPLPEICGRVCPEDDSCAGACVLAKRGKGIDTRALEAFVADYQRQNGGVPLPEKAAATGKRVAVVGAGPAGLAVAETLAAAGHAVTVYEALPDAGGLLVYGIPAFKLDKAIVQEKVDWLRDLGVEFVFNTRIGQDRLLGDLMEREKFDAYFLGTGAQVEATMRVPGEDLKGVQGSLDFLVRSNVAPASLPASAEPITSIGRRVAVIGGGDTATDCLRSALRLGAKEVICYYRRTEAEMPGNKAEREHALEEGAEINYLTAPVELLDTTGDGAVDTMKLVRMELGEPDRSGRPRPVPIEGSEYEVAVDDVLLAIGFWPDPLLGETTPNLETYNWGLIAASDETGATSLPGVYAAGDNVTGPALVNKALASARRAASAMNDYLAG